jgi:hypothetical protein
MAFDMKLLSSPAELINQIFQIENNDIKRIAGRNAKFFAYDGFNAEEIIKSFMAKAATSSGEDALNDLIDIVNVGLTRGNIRKDQLERTHKDGKTRIEALATKYSIVLKENKNSSIKLGRDTLTFTRAVSVFPFMASKLLECGAATSDQLGCPFGSDKLPIVMRHPGFCSLIPTSGTCGKLLFDCHCAFMISFGKKINPNSKKSLKEQYAHQSSFSQSAWTNKRVYNNELRLKAMVALNLHQSEKLEIYEEVANALRKAMDKTLYKSDSLKSCIKEKIISFDVVSQ